MCFRFRIVERLQVEFGVGPEKEISEPLRLDNS